ncbi:MAG TPA: GAF domain-containing protein [Ohtaekwangia sp.]|nr:GAF domain-containing protein [Ohtaekwangia sp.]
MNFWRNKTLRQYAVIVLVLIVLVYTAAYFVLSGLMDRVEDADRKIAYTQASLHANQNISILVQGYLNGNKTLRAEISAQLNEQEHRFKTLTEGGRIDGSAVFLPPLSRLPKITMAGLKEVWSNYRGAVMAVLTTSDSDPIASHNLPVRVQYEGLSLSLYKWYDKLVVDLNEEVSNARETLASTRQLFFFSNILLLAGLFYLFMKYVLKPLHLMKDNIQQHRHTEKIGSTELGHLAAEINHTLENLKDATDFVSAIGKGNLTLNYKENLDKNYVPGKNLLADSLIEMQEKLRQMNEEEQKRQWVNEGLAKFVDIMRTSHDNLSGLGDNIISGLVTYTGSNQGALYFLNDEEVNNAYLELIALFAFDIKKHEQQKIKPGQGILGQAYLEKDTVYLTELPDEYIRITSGLGGANPRAVLIVPLKVDNVIYGLIELASFDTFQAHEISFVEKLGETIGSTLASVRAAQKNRQLIEQFQQQTEEMRAQEEEMRQNMEELQATQEEVVRKEQRYLMRIQELENAQADTTTADALRKELAEKENQYLLRINELEKARSSRPAGDDWATAEELSKALKVNLEALKITREELR